MKLNKLRNQLAIAEQIIELGGRVPTIVAITGLTNRTAAKYYKEITNKSSTGGMLPFDDKWAIKTPMNCLNASYFFTIYKQLIDAKQGTSLKNIFLASYKIYKNSMNDPLMDIDRAWQVFQQVKISGSLILCTCSSCQTIYLTLKGYPLLTQLCPICDVTTDSKKRKRWRQRLKNSKK